MKRPVDIDDLIDSDWEARPDTLIGGWCIQPREEPPVHDGGIYVGSMLGEKIARHVAHLHNLDRLAKGDNSPE